MSYHEKTNDFELTSDVDFHIEQLKISLDEAERKRVKMLSLWKLIEDLSREDMNLMHEIMHKYLGLECDED